MSIKLTIEAENETELTRLLRALVADRAETEASSLELEATEEREPALWVLHFIGNNASSYHLTFEAAQTDLNVYKEHMRLLGGKVSRHTITPLYER